MTVISNTIWLWWIIGIYETKSILNWLVIILHFLHILCIWFIKLKLTNRKQRSSMDFKFKPILCISKICSTFFWDFSFLSWYHDSEHWGVLERGNRDTTMKASSHLSFHAVRGAKSNYNAEIRVVPLISASSVPLGFEPPPSCIT